MTPNKINVNTTDINSSANLNAGLQGMPLDVMGLFFFAYRDFVSAADELLVGHKFGRAHHRVLYFVNIRPGMPVADLLDILKITKQSLARVLRQLIDQGFIDQHVGHQDRRQRLLYATEKGQQFFALLSKSQTNRINQALKDLSPSAQQAVRDFLFAMIEKTDHQTLMELKLIDTQS